MFPRTSTSLVGARTSRVQLRILLYSLIAVLEVQGDMRQA